VIVSFAFDNFLYLNQFIVIPKPVTLRCTGHAFPPDIGEGVNAGLLDVIALDRALRGLYILTGKSLGPDEQP
jgi:hypothetical protein